MLHWALMTCRRVAAKATDFQEGKLGPVERLRYRWHLAICQCCTRYLRQLELTRKVCASLRDEVGEDCMHGATRDKLLGMFRANRPKP